MQGQKKHKGAAPGWPAFLAEIRLISEPLDPGVEGRVRNLVRTPDGRYFWPSQLEGHTERSYRP